MFWNLIFLKLHAEDEVQLGLCSRQALLRFWREMGCKIWYTPIVFNKSTPKSRCIRKLCINLSALDECSESLDHLTHLHVSDTNATRSVSSISLPSNLTYCFLANSMCLEQCTLPRSLRFFETNEYYTEFLNLDQHANLTVLRMPQYSVRFEVPPNLIEFSIFAFDEHTLPPSLKSLSIACLCAIEDLPQILPNLEIFNGVQVAQSKTNVQDC